MHRDAKELNLAARKRREIPLKAKVCAVFSTRMVGERSIRGEVRAEALVDCMEVRMPE